jgi:hypothetical protein
MSDPTAFNRTVTLTVRSFADSMQQIQELKDRMDSDAGLAVAAAATAQASGRADLAVDDFNNLGGPWPDPRHLEHGEPTESPFLSDVAMANHEVTNG